MRDAPVGIKVGLELEGTDYGDWHWHRDSGQGGEPAA